MRTRRRKRFDGAASGVRVLHSAQDDIVRILGAREWIIPRRSAACTSFAMYQAWRAGCEYIVMLDDDCDPKTVKPTSSVTVAFRSTIAPSLPVKGAVMPQSRIFVVALSVGAAVCVAAWSSDTRAQRPESASTRKSTAVANPITGDGLPNPAPVVTRNWGTLPAGRKWGTSAGIDIDPKDGHVWAYERCGAGTAGGVPSIATTTRSTRSSSSTAAPGLFWPTSARGSW